MTYASSVSSGEASKSSNKSISDKINKMLMSTRPQIKIVLDGAEDSWVMTYSTLDKIEGKVLITCPINTLVDSLSIDFLGTAKTFVEKLATTTAISGRTEAFHQFLKLSQPIPDSAWPTGLMLEANRTYEFRFYFVVPPQLLPRICKHPVVSSTVHQEHTVLPPSLGDSSISGRGNTLLDDFAPDMARIRYAVTASLQEHGSGAPTTKSKKVRIMPAIDEKPPHPVDGPNSEYKLRAEKDIRKGLMKSRLGSLVIEAAQPRSIRVPSYKSEKSTPDSTMVTIKLRFDPSTADAQPPKLGSLTSKFKIITYYSSAARARLPARTDGAWDTTQGLHSENISLPARCMGNVEWTPHDAPPSSASSSPSRRASTTSASSLTGAIPEASARYKGQKYYTAQILVPLSLPSNKAWIPTFHTCLISRMYSVSLHLGVTSGTLGGIDLRIPVQISSEGNPEAFAAHRDSLTLEEQAYEAMEADDFFAPRTIRPMDEGLVGGTFIGRGSLGGMGGQEMELPPGYDAFTRPGARIPVVV